MKKLLLIGAAALTAAAVAPAIARNAAPGPAHMAHGKDITRAELQAKIAEHFTKLDSDRDGVVTKAEADAARGQMRGHMAERLQARHAKAFERIDTNSDGMISRQEFDSRRDERKEARAHDGKRMGRHMRMMASHMFEMADANKDGRVTLQEATGAALRHFDMADANRDGRITPDERRQMHKRMGEHRRGG